MMKKIYFIAGILILNSFNISITYGGYSTPGHIAGIVCINRKRDFSFLKHIDTPLLSMHDYRRGVYYHLYPLRKFKKIKSLEKICIDKIVFEMSKFRSIFLESYKKYISKELNKEISKKFNKKYFIDMCSFGSYSRSDVKQILWFLGEYKIQNSDDYFMTKDTNERKYFLTKYPFFHLKILKVDLSNEVIVMLSRSTTLKHLDIRQDFMNLDDLAALTSRENLKTLKVSVLPNMTWGENITEVNKILQNSSMELDEEAMAQRIAKGLYKIDGSLKEPLLIFRRKNVENIDSENQLLLQ